MQSLNYTHVKLMAFDFLALTPCPTVPISFSRKGMPVLRVESLGIVVTREQKPGKFLKFTIDDGTGCIPCVLWLNQLVSPYFSRRNPLGVRYNADVATKLASQIQLGAVARVYGKVKGYRGTLQITVSDVVLEADPNAQVLHWLDCMMLARNYDKFPKNRAGGDRGDSEKGEKPKSSASYHPSKNKKSSGNVSSSGGGDGSSSGGHSS